MFKNIDPDNVSIKPFNVYKSFTFTQNDSGSGVFGLEGISGSITYGSFDPESSPSQSYSKTNYPYSQSFFKEPLYFGIKHLYYKNTKDLMYSFGGNDSRKENRKLHNRISVITVPKDFYGEKIVPGSVKLTDNSSDVTFDIRDDGDSNLYDYAYSSSFAAYKSSSWDSSKWTAEGSGSQIGNIFYEHGILAITDTGSYSTVGLGTGTDGWELDLKATHTIYEHEYLCVLDKNEFNSSTNISLTKERSGSITIVEGISGVHRYFAPGDNPSNGTGSFASSYQATAIAENFTTHSDFGPYVTTVGLYSDTGYLVAIGKLSRPIKNDPELALGITVRFDV
jgi:hypothetical protein